MALQKQSVTVNFSTGLDTFTDPNQLQAGKFTALSNSVFLQEGVASYGKLSKRNGFPIITTMPDGSTAHLSTYNGNLIGLGDGLRVYSQPTNQWIGKIGSITSYQHVQLSTQPLVRNNFNQTTVDMAYGNGLICLTYTESPTLGSVNANYYKYTIVDAASGQSLVPPTQLLSTFGTVSYIAKSFAVGSKFAVVFPAVLNSGSARLQYILLDQNNVNSVSAVRTLSTNYAPATVGSSGSFDGVVASNTLFVAWNGTGLNGLQSTAFDPNFVQGSVTVLSSVSLINMVNLCADTSSQNSLTLCATYTLGTSSSGIYASFFDQYLRTLPQGTPTLPRAFTAHTAWAQNGVVYSYGEVGGTLAQDATLPDKTIDLNIMGPGAGNSNFNNIARSVGLGSRAFIVGSQGYFLANHYSQYQSSYFLMNSVGGVISRLAFGNSGIAYTSGTSTAYGSLNQQSWVPSVSTIGSSLSLPYLVKTTILSPNKNTNVSSTVQTAGIYSQTGVNLVNYNFAQNTIGGSEASGNLHLNGGMIWMYDGKVPVEHGFNLYPEYLKSSFATVLGSLTAQSYFYTATYEWVDNAGNVHRSAPSIPLNVNLSASAGSGSLAIQVTPLYLTSKVSTPPKVVLYRWSNSQQTYYKAAENIPRSVNSLFGSDNGFLQVPGAITFTDTLSDQAILGNEILYTTGGVVENIGAPGTSALAQFDTRMWLINAEDPNLLQFSQTIVENTPVEFSDLLTLFIPQNIGTQLASGPCKAIAAMDDKLIIFKKNLICYVNGTGPDTTGANSQYSQPILVISGVGCSNPASVVLTPNGVMFQSDKGIWIVGRDLSVNYVGKDVEQYNGSTVLSATLVPGTNQVRFHMSSGIQLMYDYLVGQWGTFDNSGISGVVYKDLHTFADSAGNVFRESVGSYSDSFQNPIMSFTTGWVGLTGLEGYQRVYHADLLGQFKSPHAFRIDIAYDYNPTILQTMTITPTNVNGSGSSVEQWQINFAKQQCQAFQLTFTEISSASAGAGLTLSGMDIVCGAKSSYPKNIGPKNRSG